MTDKVPTPIPEEELGALVDKEVALVQEVGEARKRYPGVPQLDVLHVGLAISGWVVTDASPGDAMRFYDYVVSLSARRMVTKNAGNN